MDCYAHYYNILIEYLFAIVHKLTQYRFNIKH